MGFKIEVDREKCSGCEECLEICTAKVYEMRNGRAVPVNAKECVGCLSCMELCEQKAIKVEETGVEMSSTCAALLRDIL
jgi:NAD-dependent dihydropyrimidine dehydrogenase PreA subunit